jgi:acyl carrier protein
MTDEIETKVRAVVAKIAKKGDPAKFPADADLFRELGVESTAALDLLLSLEEEFDVQIPDQKFGDARTLRSLAALISELK